MFGRKPLCNNHRVFRREVAGFDSVMFNARGGEVGACNKKMPAWMPPSMRQNPLAGNERKCSGTVTVFYTPVIPCHFQKWYWEPFSCWAKAITTGSSISKSFDPKERDRSKFRRAPSFIRVHSWSKKSTNSSGIRVNSSPVAVKANVQIKLGKLRLSLLCKYRTSPLISSGT